MLGIEFWMMVFVLFLCIVDMKNILRKRQWPKEEYAKDAPTPQEVESLFKYEPLVLKEKEDEF